MNIIQKALLALIYSTNVHGAPVPFFGHDGNGNKRPDGAVEPLGEHPGADGAFSSFKIPVIDKVHEIETFESFEAKVEPDFTIGGKTVNATVSLKKSRGHAFIETNLTLTKSFGRNPTSGTQFLVVESGTVLKITSGSGTLIAIGFYATDMGDTNGKMTKIFTKKNGVQGKKRYNVPITPKQETNNGGVTYVGITDEDGFDEVMIGNRRGSTFGMDDVVLVVNETAWKPSCPDGLTQVPASAGNLCGQVLDGNTQYTLSEDIDCSANAGPVLSNDNTCIDGNGFTLTGTASQGIGVSGSSSTIVNLKISSFQIGIQASGSGEAILKHVEFADMVVIGISSYAYAGTSLDVSCLKIAGGLAGIDTYSQTSSFHGVEFADQTQYNLKWLNGVSEASCLRIPGPVSGFGLGHESSATSLTLSDSLITDVSTAFMTPVGDIHLSGVTFCNVTGDTFSVDSNVVSHENVMCDNGGDLCDSACSGPPYSLPASCDELCPTYGLWDWAALW